MAIAEFTDLRGMALEIEGKPGFEHLSKAIEQAWRAQGCIADIRQAKDTCVALDLLRKSPRQRGSSVRASTENALLTTAVLLYARATSTSGQKSERGSIKLSAKHMNAQQLRDHEFLVDVRNKAFAHVYRDTVVGESRWHEDVVFAVNLGEQGWRPAIASNRTLFHKPTYERLLRQLPLAEAIMLPIFHKRIDAVTSLMNDASVPIELYHRHHFDPADRFGGVAAVQRVIDGMGDGSITLLSERS